VSVLSAAVAVVDFVISAVLADRILGAGWRPYKDALLPTLGPGVLVTGVTWGVLEGWAIPPGIARLAGAGGVYVVLYAGIVWMVWPELRARVSAWHQVLRSGMKVR